MTLHRRAELGAFLRARRLALQPQEAGLAVRHARRRTPGLRREDVAERAAISVSWYTWLEQGRDIHVSDDVLDSIAEALLLDTAGREYLRSLARPSSRWPETGWGGSADQLQRVLDGQSPRPAYAMDPRFRLAAWNDAALDVFGDFSGLPSDDRHVLRMLFGATLKSLIVNWEPNAEFTVAAFRAATARFVGERWLADLIDELQATSSDFRRWWCRHDVCARPVATKELDHPDVGRLVLEQTSLLLDDGSGARVVLYTPQPGTGTQGRLEELARRHRPRPFLL